MRGAVVAAGKGDPGQQQAAAGGVQPSRQFSGAAQVAERQAQQRLQLIGLPQHRRLGPGQDRPRRLDGCQRLSDMPPGGPDPGPVEQREELKQGPPPLGDREHPFGEVFRGVEVAALQRAAGQDPQAIHGEKVLAEAQPPGLLLSGGGRLGGLRQVAGFEPGQRPRAGHHHQPGRFGLFRHRQSRGRFTLYCLEVFQAVIDTHEDQRDGGVPLVGELRPLLDGPGGEGRPHGLVQLAGFRVVEGPHRREPGRQLGVSGDRRRALEQVKVVAAACRVTPQQQVGRQGQQLVWGIRYQ